jgi:hypothetical protein
LPADTVGGKFERYDCVVLFLVDGFGWEFFERFSDKLPFLQRFESEGIASKISAQFPSTTAAHVTTINTGQEVGLTGIYEWFYYEPLIQEMISPLLFSYAGDHVPETLLRAGFDAQTIFPFETFYQKLGKEGVKSIVMQQAAIAHSAYSSAMLKGAENIPYTHFTQALERLGPLCEQVKQPTYIFVYFGDIDGAGHRHGIDSTQLRASVEYYWNAIETFWQRLSPKKKIALLFTADHGMAPVFPKETIYLNRLIPNIANAFEETASGKKRVPAGSCRDFFLHCKPHLLEETQKLLQDKLSGKADVLLVEPLIEAGFFGKGRPSKRLKERLGNLLILPYYQESVWWFEPHRFEQHFFAAHGGLTPQEMESIFLFIER